jgi:hypothetical protein
MKDKLKSIQDNKQMLEKKILEYERKLQQIQKKGKLQNKMRWDDHLSLKVMNLNFESHPLNYCLNSSSTKLILLNTL